MMTLGLKLQNAQRIPMDLKTCNLCGNFEFCVYLLMTFYI